MKPNEGMVSPVQGERRSGEVRRSSLDRRAKDEPYLSDDRRAEQRRQNARRADDRSAEEMTIHELSKIKAQIELLQEQREQDQDLLPVERQYQDARREFESGKEERHKEIAKLSAALLQQLLGSIVKENHFLLTSGDAASQAGSTDQAGGQELKAKSFTAAYNEAYGSVIQLSPDTDLKPHNRLPLNWPVVTLCELFDDMLSLSLGDVLGGAYKRNEQLLRSFSWASIGQLCQQMGSGAVVAEEGLANGLQEEDKTANSRHSQNARPRFDTRDLECQQILCAIVALMRVHHEIRITPFHLLADFTAMTNEITRIREGHTKVSGIDSDYSYLRPSATQIGIRPFEWIKFRGMLINASDGSRNISFKVESMVRVLDTFYSAVAAWCMPNAEGRAALTANGIEEGSPEVSIKQLAGQLLFESGYASGSQFGWTMHEIFQKQPSSLDFTEKIQKWCDFDSDVGFGLLRLRDNGIQEDDVLLRPGAKKDPVEDSMDGAATIRKYTIQIELAHNFVTYRRETSQVNLCGFMCGYIQGVLEKISGQPYHVQHGAGHCEQYVPELDCCTFFVTTDVDKLRRDFEEARKRVPHGYHHRSGFRATDPTADPANR